MNQTIENIDWLFFDVGSTLTKEDAAYQDRIERAIAGQDISYQEFYDKMLGYFQENKKGDLTALDFYGLERPNWRPELEVLYPKVREVLEKLHAHYKVGIIANQLPGLKQRLEAFGIQHCFDLVLSSAEVGLSKPNPAIFQLALTKAGCSPQQAVMIGDRLDNDIAPAKALGMKTIWMKQGFSRYCHPKEVNEHPDWTAEQLTDLLTLLLK